MDRVQEGRKIGKKNLPNTSSDHTWCTDFMQNLHKLYIRFIVRMNSYDCKIGFLV